MVIDSTFSDSLFTVSLNLSTNSLEFRLRSNSSSCGGLRSATNTETPRASSSDIVTTGFSFISSTRDDVMVM